MSGSARRLDPDVFTLLKLAALVILLVAGLLLAPTLPNPQPQPPIPAPTFFLPILLALSTAFVPCSLPIAAGSRPTSSPRSWWSRTNLPLALVLGVLGVVVVYLLANLAYLRSRVDGLARSPRPRRTP